MSETPSQIAPTGSNPNRLVLFRGKHLNLCSINGWEYAERPKISGVVAILPITDAREIILVEQFRPPVARKVIEIPAGLAGDITGSEMELLEEAARRELLEETGYEAREMKYLTEGPSSAGLTSETISFFQALGLRKVGAGGGDSSEEIQVHTVPLTDLTHWLGQRRRDGCAIDYKMYVALYWADLGR